MKLTQLEHDLFQEILEKCSGSCLSPLRRLAGPSWQAKAPVLRGIREELKPRAILAGPSDDCYGNWFWTAGVGFLAVFPRESGRYLCEELLKGHSRSKSALIGRDVEIVAEASNILVNRFAAPLAEALELELFLSAPESSTGDLNEQLSCGLLRHPGLGAPSLFCGAPFRLPGRLVELAIFALLDLEMTEFLRSRVYDETARSTSATRACGSKGLAQ